MTTVTLFTVGENAVGFEAKGHAGFADAGKDVVCAAVTAATEVVIDILGSAGIRFRLDIDEKTACVRVRIDERDVSRAKPILDGFVTYIEDVRQAAPTHVSFHKTEVQGNA